MISVLWRGSSAIGCLLVVVLLAGCLASDAAPSDPAGPTAGQRAEETVWSIGGLTGTVAHEFRMSVQGDGYCRLDRDFRGGWGTESGLLSYLHDFGEVPRTLAAIRGDTDVHVTHVNPGGTAQGATFAHLGTGWWSQGWRNVSADDQAHFAWVGVDVRAPEAPGAWQMRVVCADAVPQLDVRWAQRVVAITSTGGDGLGLRYWDGAVEGAVNINDRFDLLDAQGRVFVGFTTSEGPKGAMDPIAFRNGDIVVTTPDGDQSFEAAAWDDWLAFHGMYEHPGDYRVVFNQTAVQAGSLVGFMAQFA